MADVVLEPMNVSNRAALRALRVRDDQRDFLDTPDIPSFVDDAPNHPTFGVHVIRRGDGEVVGLVSVGFDGTERERAWIPLLVIGEQYQRRGYGTDALSAVVDLMHREHPACVALGLSYKAENLQAARVYARLGFTPAGGPDARGEITAWLPLRG